MKLLAMNLANHNSYNNKRAREGFQILPACWLCSCGMKLKTIKGESKGNQKNVHNIEHIYHAVEILIISMQFYFRYLRRARISPCAIKKTILLFEIAKVKSPTEYTNVNRFWLTD